MNPRIDEAALLAARAAGPNPPPLDRLKAAAEYAIERTGAPQLILFGSAARGEFTPESDFDFLAVAPLKLPGAAGKPERLEHPTTGDDIHVLLADIATIEAKRWIVGTVFCEAMSQGCTVGTIRTAGRVKGGMTLVKTHDGCREAMDDALYGIETLLNNLRRFDHGDAITTPETDLEEAACKQRPRA